MGDKGGGMFLSTLKEKNDARRAQQQQMKSAQSQATMKTRPSFMGGFGSFLSRNNSDNMKKKDDVTEGKPESMPTLKQVAETSTTTTAITDDATGRANSVVREETTHKSIVLENGSENPIAVEVESKTVVAMEEKEGGETVRRESKTVTIAMTAEPASAPTAASGNVVPLGGSFWNKPHLEEAAQEAPVVVITQTETTTTTTTTTTNGPETPPAPIVKPDVIADQPSGRSRRASTTTAKHSGVDKRVSLTAGYVRDASSDHSLGGRERTPSVATMEEVYRGVPRDNRNFEMLNPLLGPEVVQRRNLAQSMHETGLTEAKRASLYNSAPHVDQVTLLERRNTRAGRSGSIDVPSVPLSGHDSSNSM